MTSADVFDARLARIVMLPDGDRVSTALTSWIGKPQPDFNRGIHALSLPSKQAEELGVKIPKEGFASGQENTTFDFEFHAVEFTTVRALFLHVYKPKEKQPLPCECGEQGDTVYIAVAPPTMPELWELKINNSAPDPNANLHQGLESMAQGLSDYALDYLTKAQIKRFEGENPAAELFQASTWDFNVHIIGYGFGGALAQILAVKLQPVTSVNIKLHLVTFGAPSVGREGVAYRLASVRRFAHARDPFPRLMPGYVHIGPALEEDTRVEYGGKRSSQICQELSCHTAYLGVDFRDRALMDFYSKIPMSIAVLMLPKFAGKDLQDLWSLAYHESRLLTAEGDVPCPWVAVVGKKSK